MGQQQLTIIALVVFITGFAMYGAQRTIDWVNQTHDRDMILLQMNIVVTEAKKYAAKIESLGGGQGDFIGFKAPKNLLKTDEVWLTVNVRKNRLTFQGFGVARGRKGRDKKTPVYVVAEYHRLQDRWTSITYVN
ncbi:MAG: hypothetical protein L0Y80_06540 [Ignavibacteriae bacterium]|nr:hypothetical protein [Ignavibacteriota bacterium]